ncbi:MAG: MFS transporter [Lachnospiraceae bacterium]|nr:MFS transporter [Lachnospiraceae bacterium]
MKKERNQFWTLRYTLINVTYFMVFCWIHAYASVFLLDKGFSNTMIGITLALANILSVILQPFIAGIIDKPGRFTNRNVSMISTLLILIGSVILLSTDNNKVVIFLIFALIYMIQMIYQPVITAMNFEYAQAGCNIYYGLARGLGSVGFAIASFFTGKAIGSYGVDILMKLNIIILSAALIALYFFKKPESAAVSEISEDNGDTPVAHNNVFDFIRTYPMFMLFVLGAVCFFFSHNAINDYIIQIITPLGGDEADMGRAIFLAAVLELPTMSFINKVMKKVSCSRLLIISGIAFMIKTFLMFIADNMITVYISQAMQLFAYAVFIPVSAYYVNMVMEEYDQVKGQAYITCSITLGGVFSSLLCGRILDTMGPRFMLLVSLIVSIAGVIIAFIALRKDMV